jgi:hypothetical protein
MVTVKLWPGADDEEPNEEIEAGGLIVSKDVFVLAKDNPAALVPEADTV